MPITIAPQNAGQKPATWKSRPNLDASALVSRSITAFRTNVNRPSVMIEQRECEKAQDRANE